MKSDRSPVYAEERGRIHIFIATSDIHMKYKLQMTPSQVLESAVSGVKRGRSYTKNIEFSCEDAVRTDLKFLAEVVTAVIDAGAIVVNIPDTVGYPSMQLGGTPQQLFTQVRDGVADLAWTLPSYQAGLFTKSEVFELPFMTKYPETASPAMWDYIQKNALDEYKGVKLIATHTHDGAHLHFGKKQVKSLEDLKGLKIRATSRIDSKTLAALGAIPVQMPMPAVPEAIAKGVVDGTSLPWEISTAYKIQEICKSHTETPAHQAKRANAIFVLAMNLDKYNKLPPDLRKVIDQNSGRETSRWVGMVWDSGTAPARKIADDRHNTINVLSDAEYKRWVKATESVDDGWIKEVDAKGGNGRALLNDAKALLKKYNN